MSEATKPMYMLQVAFTVESNLDDLNIRETAEHALNVACSYMESEGISPSYKINRFEEI